MRRLFLILFTLSFIFTLNLTGHDLTGLSNDFKEIINIDQENSNFINLDIKDLTYKKMFYYFVLVSEELDQYESYDKWFQNAESEINNRLIDKFNRVDVVNWQEDKQKEFAENLLVFIHEVMFKRYYFLANKISDIVNKGEFNCVSSSIIYAIFLKKYGIDSVAVETIDHVFIKIPFKSEDIDVESTNSLGFDPGKKKEILNQFGEVTGFSYVSPKDYKNRNEIDLKKLLINVYHNLANYYMKKGDLLKSAEIGYLIYKGRNDERGKNDFEINFFNYINDLSRKNKNLEAIETINSYMDFFGKDKKTFDTRFGFLNNFVYYWNSTNDIPSTKDFLLAQNDKYPEVKDDKRFVQIYFDFVNKVTTYYNKNNNYQSSYNFIKDFNKMFKYNDIEKTLNNTIADEMFSYEKTKDYETIDNRLNSLKNDFPEYLDTIKKIEMFFLINKVDFILSKNEYLNALNEAKKLDIIFPGNQNVKNVLLNCYVKITVDFYEKRDLKNVIFYSEEGLKKLPDDRTLKGNYLIFFKNFINEELNKRNYREARRILNIALDKFPKDSYLVQTNNDLKSMNY